MYEAKNVSDYIEKILKLISNKEDKFTLVYRGEDKVHAKPCEPNIFRKDYLFRNKFFEKNLFEEMRANRITEGKTYLERAIDAQHDEFPSRLLDVSYNSLIALYFAVTPYYHEKEDIYDKNEKNSNENNGCVYVFFIEKFFCPSGDIINKVYDELINRNEKSFLTHPIFQKNHKLIDHIKINKRIIAQQGAFILFQGDEVSPIPECYYEKIEIPAECKSKIRKQLKNLFGIYTGSIYPEPTNLVNEISRKSCQINNNKFTYDNEMNLVIHNLENQLEYYRKKIIAYAFEKNEEAIFKLIYKLETEIYSYKIAIEDEENLIINNNDKEKEKILSEMKVKYNNLLVLFFDSISSYLQKFKIEVSEEIKFEEK
ncbi:FRG domain-containing protein [Clostridium neonatale]|uniref:FRG domain-containing protein n=1 Tax=Clostridium neonatale TaxID=137838 RepID=A0A2A7MIH1_9CLOT|nr:MULTISPECIES: FRG domain-containing protein [Clostridium]MDU4846720.1 FRG domain-containing protein [Clostridium sp.]PEG27565.1 FRG domain-containing protein [Clostridium neonatale]PEG31273.1 FRG domain-containing protein [Clostridium neonatale]